MGPNIGAKKLNQILVWVSYFVQMGQWIQTLQLIIVAENRIWDQVFSLSRENKKQDLWVLSKSYWEHKGWEAFLESLLMSDSQDSNKVQQCQLLNQYKQTNAHTQKETEKIYSYSSLCFRAEWAIQASIMQNFLFNKLAIKWRLCTK